MSTVVTAETSAREFIIVLSEWEADSLRVVLFASAHNDTGLRLLQEQLAGALAVKP